MGIFGNFHLFNFLDLAINLIKYNGDFGQEKS